jgi:hypothetical protein
MNFHESMDFDWKNTPKERKNDCYYGNEYAKYAIQRGAVLKEWRIYRFSC